MIFSFEFFLIFFADFFALAIWGSFYMKIDSDIFVHYVRYPRDFVAAFEKIPAIDFDTFHHLFAELFKLLFVRSFDDGRNGHSKHM